MPILRANSELRTRLSHVVSRVDPWMSPSSNSESLAMKFSQLVCKVPDPSACPAAVKGPGLPPTGPRSPNAAW